MEYTSHPATDCTPLLSIKWQGESERFRNRVSQIWQGNIFQLTIRSSLHGAIAGQIVNIDIRFNQESYPIKIINSMWKRSKDGEIPDLRSNTHRLVIKLTPISFDLYEKKLEANEIQKNIQNPFAKYGKHLNKSIELEQNGPSHYNFQPRQNESWIMVSNKLETCEWRIAIPLKTVILWVKRILDRKVDPNTNLYRYEFFSTKIRPLSLEMNGFVCTKAYDECMGTNDGIKCSIFFEITDCKGEKRLLNSYRQGEEGLLAILDYMLKISEFRDWKDVDIKLGSTPYLGVSK